MNESGVKSDYLNVLFVCTGNTCRSPMAAGIFKHNLSPDLSSKLRVSSAGTIAAGGFPAHEYAFITCQSRGIDIGDHRSCPLTREVVAEFDLIFGMENYHVGEVEARGGSDKVYLLTEYPNFDSKKEIADPIGHNLEFYEKTFSELETHILSIISHIENTYPNILL